MIGRSEQSSAALPVENAAHPVFTTETATVGPGFAKLHQSRARHAGLTDFSPK
jgi:hypothetical protein